MNIGGQRELLKTMLGALPTYLLVAIKPSKRFYTYMDQLQRRFIWAGSKQLHRGKCKVNRARVCRSLQFRGL
jgi:hypothetical protein